MPAGRGPACAPHERAPVGLFKRSSTAPACLPALVTETSVLDLELTAGVIGLPTEWPGRPKPVSRPSMGASAPADWG